MPRDADGNSKPTDSRRDPTREARGGGGKAGAGPRYVGRSSRKAASHREREAGPKKRFDAKQAELAGSITC